MRSKTTTPWWWRWRVKTAAIARAQHLGSARWARCMKTPLSVTAFAVTALMTQLTPRFVQLLAVVLKVLNSQRIILTNTYSALHCLIGSYNPNPIRWIILSVCSRLVFDAIDTSVRDALHQHGKLSKIFHSLACLLACGVAGTSVDPCWLLVSDLGGNNVQD